MKKRSIALAIALGAVMIGISASAQEPGLSNARATQIVRLSGSITGILESTSGGCTHGFSNQCPSGHTCSCLTGTGLEVSSKALGEGTASVFATIDNTAGFATQGDCGPIYAEIDVTARNDSPTFDAVGGICFEPNGLAAFNGVMGLAATTKLFTSTGSAGYAGVLECTSGLCGGSFFVTLKFKGTAK